MGDLPVVPMPGSLGDQHVSFDLHILDCSICMEVLSPPIYQCCNGHYTCNECKRKMNSRCPTCAEPAGKIRSLGLEKILESLKVSCKFWSQGCTELALPYMLKKKHERKCTFSPHGCPILDCNFSGRLDSFISHFEDCHCVQTITFRFGTRLGVVLSVDDKYLLLQGGNDYYLLQAHEEHVGKLLYVSHIFPPDSEDEHTYQLEVDAGREYLRLSSDIQSFHQGKPDLNVIRSLLVPRCFLEDGQLSVMILINSYTKAVPQ